jgi:hypothetical protein
MIDFKELGIAPVTKGFVGDKISINAVLNMEIIVERFQVGPSKFEGKEDRLDMQIIFEGKQRVLWISSKTLIDMISQVPQNKFPFKTKIIMNNKRPEFT